MFVFAGTGIMAPHRAIGECIKPCDMVVGRHAVIGIDKAAGFRAKSKTQLFIQMRTVIRLALLGIYRAPIREKPNIPRKLHNHPRFTADTWAKAGSNPIIKLIDTDLWPNEHLAIVIAHDTGTIAFILPLSIAQKRLSPIDSHAIDFKNTIAPLHQKATAVVGIIKM